MQPAYSSNYGFIQTARIAVGSHLIYVDICIVLFSTSSDRLMSVDVLSILLTCTSHTRNCNRTDNVRQNLLDGLGVELNIQ
jgi:hypothetical protein